MPDDKRFADVVLFVHDIATFATVTGSSVICRSALFDAFRRIRTPTPSEAPAFTVNTLLGLVVPMPTLPEASMLIRCTPFVLNPSVFVAGRYIPLPVAVVEVGTNFVA
jgi:hypothetical protein